jgi:hypothetical protein
VKQAIDADDAQQLYEVLLQNAKRGRIDLVIDNVYDGFRGRTCLHRYHRHKLVSGRFLKVSHTLVCVKPLETCQ